MLWCALLFGYQNPLQGQDDFYPLPEPNASGFGYPYPPPAIDEPGVTAFRRPILDGHPELIFQPRPQDEVWLISTRNISAGTIRPAPLSQFVCKRSVGTAWETVPVENLLHLQNNDTSKPTVFFIHGNRTEAFWARRRGKQAYQSLIGNSAAPLPAVRFVIWSWPSDPMKENFLADFRLKMDRSFVDGQIFGEYLSRLNPQQKVTIATYSLGAQIAATGVETASKLQRESPELQLLVSAPVIHCHWKVNDEQIAVFDQRIEAIRMFRNSKDRALIAYRIFCEIWCNGGFVSGADILAKSHHNVVEHDVSNSVGSEHNIVGYLSQPALRAEFQQLMSR